MGGARWTATLLLLCLANGFQIRPTLHGPRGIRPAMSDQPSFDELLDKAKKDLEESAAEAP